jgi:AraC-like DNA-binding protein
MADALQKSNRREWTDCYVSYREAYQSFMVDFHTHDYYEISLILSGNVKSLLPNRAESGPQSRLVLTAPNTPHFISLESPDFYSRINLNFTSEFVKNYVPEWESLAQVFGENGNILLLNDTQREVCQARLLALQKESNPFRRRLRILEFISFISEFDQTTTSETTPPPYVLRAISYINEHYREHIVAADLAWELNVGRTTLMTAFRKHTGTTLNQYLIRVRLKEAVKLLNDGMTQTAVADLTGFGNGGVLNRVFHKYYGITPKQYMNNNPQRKEKP